VPTCGTNPTGVSSQPVTNGQRRKPGRSPACGLSGVSCGEGGQTLSVETVGSAGGQQEGEDGMSGAAPGGAFGGQHPAFACGCGGQGGVGGEDLTRIDFSLNSFKAASLKG